MRGWGKGSDVASHRRRRGPDRLDPWPNVPPALAASVCMGLSAWPDRRADGGSPPKPPAHSHSTALCMVNPGRVAAGSRPYLTYLSMCLETQTEGIVGKCKHNQPPPFYNMESSKGGGYCRRSGSGVAGLQGAPCGIDAINTGKSLDSLIPLSLFP